MKKFESVVMVICIIGFAGPAFAADFSLHGDLNNRITLYTNHADWFQSPPDHTGLLHDGDVEDLWAEIKYRLWVNAATDDGVVKGVVATEIGSIRFGEPDALDYSGDDIRLEVRWAYVDFQVPGFVEKSRIRIGLQPINVNYWLWKETVGGVKWYGSSSVFDYQLAWFRGHEIEVDQNFTEDDAHEDADAFLARLNYMPDDQMNAGFFMLYQNNDGGLHDAVINPEIYQIKSLKNVNYDLMTIGFDGSYKINNFFFNYDLMYQDGEMDGTYAGVTDEYDIQAWFAHLDAGINFGNHKLTYTFWYASGDDDPNDDDFEGFISTDVDMVECISLMKGGYTDDDYFTERPYLLDKGMIFNRLSLDSKITDKLTAGTALIYMMTAEDIEYIDGLGNRQSDDSIGLEWNVYFKYMLYNNLEFAINAGYLFADDAMDYWETDEIKDGDSDEDIFSSTARIRYKF